MLNFGGVPRDVLETPETSFSSSWAQLQRLQKVAVGTSVKLRFDFVTVDSEATEIWTSGI